VLAFSQPELVTAGLDLDEAYLGASGDASLEKSRE
jgi:hypothetical protein